MKTQEIEGWYGLAVAAKRMSQELSERELRGFVLRDEIPFRLIKHVYYIPQSFIDAYKRSRKPLKEYVKEIRNEQQ